MVQNGVSTLDSATNLDLLGDLTRFWKHGAISS